MLDVWNITSRIAIGRVYKIGFEILQTWITSNRCARNLVTCLCSDILVTGLAKRVFFFYPVTIPMQQDFYNVSVSQNSSSLRNPLAVSFITFLWHFVSSKSSSQFSGALIHRLDLGSTIVKPWAKLLMAGRNLDLFEASMSNAIFWLSGQRLRHDVERARHFGTWNVDVRWEYNEARKLLETLAIATSSSVRTIKTCCKRRQILLPDI